jgi:hypothetical protein
MQVANTLHIVNNRYNVEPVAFLATVGGSSRLCRPSGSMFKVDRRAINRTQTTTSALPFSLLRSGDPAFRQRSRETLTIYAFAALI